MRVLWRLLMSFATSFILCEMGLGPASGQTTALFVAPPRNIADITAILDQEKPDPAKIAKLKEDAERPIPSDASGAALAQFYYERAQARADLSQFGNAIADARKAIELGRGTVAALLFARYRAFLANQFWQLGEPKKALQVLEPWAKEADVQGPARGHLPAVYRGMSLMYLQLGDLRQAETYAQRTAAIFEELRTSTAFLLYRNTWEADVYMARAWTLAAKGRFGDAEAAYVRTEALVRASLADMPGWVSPPPLGSVVLVADTHLLNVARMKAHQGRLAEAEADARRVLLARLKVDGKFNFRTPKFINGLAGVLLDQGRLDEAERLTTTSLEIYRTVGVAEDTSTVASTLSRLGAILVLQGRHREAAEVFDALEKAVSRWDVTRRETMELNTSRIYLLYAGGRIEAGIAAAQTLLERATARYGDEHVNTAIARGILAVGLAKAGHEADARREFRAAIPILIASLREVPDDDETTVVALRRQRLQTIIEAYIALVGRDQQRTDNGAMETFALADAIRGQSVQSALVASSARMTVQDLALKNLARRHQDLTKEVNALLGLLNNVLALPPAERDENVVNTVSTDIDKLRVERDKTLTEIQRRFRKYSALIDPKPPTMNEIRAMLKPDEALLSFYFGRERSFVWAVSQGGPVGFVTIAATAAEIDAKIATLRQVFEVQTLAVASLPPFDLSLAHEIYLELLKPVEHTWKPAKRLIVVTHRALGLLPLGVLPVAPAAPVTDSRALFAYYRDVSWLARTHAVSLVPSIAAFRALRQLPAATPKREAMIGFGDPYFNEQQAVEAARKVPVQLADRGTATRGAFTRRAAPQIRDLDSVGLGQLPRLPDTAEELQSIARALRADLGQALKLGRDANENVVKTSELGKYRVVAFSTHGLMAGDLDGLTQPALAMTAPSVAGVPGDGLLTMEEVLALKLDADWVVLSACNTAAGAVSGAEAASGLARAFFYAGSRALLVTNWSVESTSARALISDIFRRHADNPALTRDETLRQAMMALLDGPGAKDSEDEVVFTYGHPLFWAPYALIGDNG
jgi:CHAT domain-containing protein